METEIIVQGNNMSITSTSFLFAWVQSVQRTERISRELSAGSICSYCALLICFYSPDGTLFTNQKQGGRNWSSVCKD